MFCDHNPGLESRNYIDGLAFGRHDPCLWVIYPPGAAGDLLISIIDRHYLRTGCEYYGINDRGRVMLYTSDYEMIDIALSKNGRIEFTDQWFYDFSDQLSRRNLTYSMLDQVIFGCHLHHPADVKHILANFDNAKIINIYARDNFGKHLIDTMRDSKLHLRDPDKILLYDQNSDYHLDLVHDQRVLNLPFGFLFDRACYDRYYAAIRKFLGLSGPLICFDYVDFYLSKQNETIKIHLQNYSKNL